MAKLIGTGKDPRFPQGQDYDVADIDLEHHVEAGLGTPVEPGEEALAVHRGYDTIAADPAEEPVGRPGHPGGTPPVQADLGSASRTAARVETTAGPGEEPQDSEAAVEGARENADDLSVRGDATQVRRGTEPLAGESQEQAADREAAAGQTGKPAAKQSRSSDAE